MARYCVASRAQGNGENEIDVLGCSLMPAPNNHIFLGGFSRGAPAVQHALAVSQAPLLRYCSHDRQTS